MPFISIYDKQKHSANGGQIDIEFLFANIKNGFYKTKVDEIRLAKQNFRLEESRLLDIDEKERLNDEKYLRAKSRLKDLKNNIHRVTISGLFSDESREAKNLKRHSSLIDIDIDNISQDELKDLREKLCFDKYCYACFTTCGGDGLAFICKIESDKHDEAWDGLQDYFYKNYKIRIDKIHKSVAATRNVSYDPDLFFNPKGSSVFKDYIKKKKEKPLLKFVYAKNDFEECVAEIVGRHIDFCPDYDIYRAIGFAIGSKFGELGLDYFQNVCQFSQLYDHTQTEKDYKWFCKNPDKGITISTFFGRCKELNISVYSKQTELIASVASSAQKTGKSKEDVIKNLEKHEGLSKDITEDIVNQVFDNKIDFKINESVIIDIQNWLRHNYDLKLNVITQNLENGGQQWEDADYNTCIVNSKIIFGNDTNSKLMMEILNSHFIPSYNPIQDFFKENKSKCPALLKGDIAPIVLRLWNTFSVENKQYLIKFGTKYLVSIIAAAHYDISSLMLILVGKQNVGKSEFFFRLLPKELQRYVGNPDLASGKDLHIALGQNLIAIDDEVSGKSKKEDKDMKKLLSAPFFNLRKPFGHAQVKIKRLAVFGGTANEMPLLTDQTGNRRLIPIHVISRNFKAFDEIDKTELLMALYQMYIDGYEWKISSEEMEELKSHTVDFNSYTAEYEMVNKFFEKGDTPLTTTEIQVFLQNRTNLKLRLNVIGAELTRMGFIKKSARRGGLNPDQCWLVKEIEEFKKPF